MVCGGPSTRSGLMRAWSCYEDRCVRWEKAALCSDLALARRFGGRNTTVDRTLGAQSLASVSELMSIEGRL